MLKVQNMYLYNSLQSLMYYRQSLAPDVLWHRLLIHNRERSHLPLTT
jgi:hypothetical protein